MSAPPATSSGPAHASGQLQQVHESRTFDSRKHNDKPIQVVSTEYAKLLTQNNRNTRAASSMSSENQAKPNGKDSKDLSLEKSLLEIYNMSKDGSATITVNLAEQIGFCGRDLNKHKSPSPPSFPDDCYEDEPEDDDDDRDLDDEDEDDRDLDDEDEDDQDYDDEDDEGVMYEDESSDDQSDSGVHEYAHQHVKTNGAVNVLKVRNGKDPDAQKLKLDQDRTLLLQKLRLEDEVRRKREQEEKQRRERKERIEQEARKRREAAEADQSARSFLFKSTSDARVDIVKRIVEMSPAESGSTSDIPTFSTAAATNLNGWEYIATTEAIKKKDGQSWIQETLLHTAARVGCLDLVAYFVMKGIQLDSLDFEGKMPLHTAAELNAPPDVCKLLLEKAPYLIDKTSVNAGKTALHYAAQNGNGDLVAFLLQHHARINATDKEGNTPEMLAKAGMGREKSKAKVQKYRVALQHIRKTLEAIKEAQKQKEAQLKEQRRKEEELAREEAEKDRAARRKQEEKLEADQRRREEEEKELARLKALAGDPHGHIGGSKKKKKKKGKGGQDATPAKPTTVPVQSIAAGSSSPSPVGSPAMAHRTQRPQSPAVRPTVQPASPSKPPSPAATQASTPVLAQTPVAAPTAIPPKMQSNPTPPKTAPPPPDSKLVQTTVSRLPKVKTAYRPSPLVVSRMADMGFPERDARKALIQTAGKFEEAIELLTSGAPLADDSEDEAEQAAQAARKKATTGGATSSPPPVVKQKQVVVQASPKLTTRVVSPQASSPPSVPAPPPPASKPPEVQSPPHGVPAPKQSGQKTSPSAPPKGPVNHPVQILQRPQNLAPHVLMRSIPTQVLQRPSAQSQTSTLSTTQTPIPKHESSVHETTPVAVSVSRQEPAPHELAPVAAPMPAPATANITPFLAPLIAPPAPPTRTPYSYGSSLSQNQVQRPSTPLGHAVSPKKEPTPTTAPTPSNRPPYTSQPPPGFTSNGMTDQHHLSPRQAPHLDHGPSGYALTETTWDTQLGVHDMSPTAIPIMATHIPPAVQDNLWGTAMGTGGINPPNNSYISAQPLPPISAPAGSRRASFDLLASNLNEMLRQSQMEMLGENAADESTIKDVLAMTGAIDLDELEDTLLETPSTDASGAASRPNAPCFAAIGEGRVQPGSTSRNPVASLWEYGSFTQDISRMGQSWHGQTMDPQTHEDIPAPYQWNPVLDGLQYQQHTPSGSAVPTGPLVLSSAGSIRRPNRPTAGVDYDGSSRADTQMLPAAAGIEALHNSLLYHRYPKLNESVMADLPRLSNSALDNTTVSPNSPGMQLDWRDKR
ncbi:hypothetical protein BGX31_007899 [Mortierella sp. GBA43]|nr:hypothetical protein BGX31_007899 [Mortierella sp. GBA43]